MVDALPAAEARALPHTASQATLTTAAQDRDGWPFASLVLIAQDRDGSPLPPLSDLAGHSRNIKADDRVALDSARLVAGFGRIQWLAAEALLDRAEDA